LSFVLPEAQVFTGIDWAAEAHAVCVLNAAGKVVAEFTVEHSATGDRRADPPPGPVR